MHAGMATGAFGGAAYGAAILGRGVPNLGGGAMRTPPLGPSVELPYGATNRVRSVPTWARRWHATPATGAFGEAPYGAPILVRGVPK